ncbi:MAG: hypothetical protein JO354_13660 [Verrucomicrobia bacterium]|nr:hypothetical protein [Verrucomicrobiota bacterium]
MFQDEIRRQILDENKREWSINEYEGDPDSFFTAVVVPLRALRDIDAVSDYEELALHINGESRISHVWIGAVNLNLL